MTTIEPIPHPYSATLDLMMRSIHRLPQSVPAQTVSDAQNRIATLQNNPLVSYHQVREVMIRIGRETWPHRKAFNDMYAAYGRASEESFVLHRLGPGVGQKYANFIKVGGKLDHIRHARRAEDLMQPTPFERYFTPDEKLIIGQALITAQEDAFAEITELISGPKKDEYDRRVKEHQAQLTRMMTILDELRTYAKVSEKWRSQIIDRMHTIEEGWSLIEPTITEAELNHEREYWRGILADFLKE